nr:MucBP domain-containing protein [Weissella coleopterorum]
MKNPVKAADVTAKYVDENGKEIAKSEVQSGNIGDKYKTEQKKIAGYTFKEVQGNATGDFTEQAQTVTYVYQKNDNNSGEPAQPGTPDTPNHAGDVNQPNQDVNPGVNDDLIEEVTDGVKTLLPQTAVQKLTIVGVMSLIIATLTGLVIWKKRK